MAHPDQRYWLFSGSVLAGLGAGFMGLSGSLDATRPHFAIWTNAATILVYLAFGAVIGCLICALRGVAFPFAARSSVQGREPAGKATQRHIACTEEGGRVLIEAGPRELSRLFGSHTTAQAQRLLEPCYGQWLRVNGRLADVGDWAQACSQVVLRKRLRGPQILLRFTDRHVFQFRLSILRPGAHIVVIGKITEISGASITLSECELEYVGR